MIVILGLFLAAVLLLARRRRARAARLAGITAVAPTFMVAPPTRRLGNLKGERL